MLEWLATGFGLGRVPRAPGTAGSLLGVGLWWLLKDWGLLPGVGALLLCVLGSVWVAGVTAKRLGESDPSCVVIDEVVGMPVALLWVAPVLWEVVAAFVAFRVFDIWKPFPIRQSQRLPGGWGIVADDVLAGVYAGVVTRALSLFL